MAGTYPDVPGHRMAYDRDGSAGAIVETSGGVTSLSGGDMVTINDEASGYVAMSPSTKSLAIIFPELRDVVGYAAVYESTDGSAPSTVYTSVDTTNGYDGTWVNRGTFVNTTIGAGLRTIQSVTWSGIKAVRFHGAGGNFGGSNRFLAIHVFGTPASGQNPNRLRLWHPTLDQEITGAYFDWGDVPRSTALTKQFRVKNNSSTLTANSVALTREALTDTSPTNVSAHEFSTDGVNYAGTVNIGNLAPGAISSVLTMRRTTPSTAVLSLWWARIVASASSWT